MKVANVTLPLLGMLFLSGNSVTLASSASQLDPYAYIQAPSRAQREQQKKKTRKFKVKRLKAAKDTIEKLEPIAKSSPRPATVIIDTNAPQAEEKVVARKPEKNSEKTNTPVAKTASNEEPADSGNGFLDGIKQSTGGLAKSTKAVGSSMVSSTKSVGSKIAEGFKSASDKVRDGAASAGGKLAVVPKKLGDGVKSTGEKMKEGSSSVSEKVASGFKSAGGSLASIPKAFGNAAGKVGASTGDGAKKLAAAPAAGFGAIGHGISKINPFHKNEAGAGSEIASKGNGNTGAHQSIAAKVPQNKAVEGVTATSTQQSDKTAVAQAQNKVPDVQKEQAEDMDGNVAAAANTGTSEESRSTNRNSVPAVAESTTPAAASETTPTATAAAANASEASTVADNAGLSDPDDKTENGVDKVAAAPDKDAVMTQAAAGETSLAEKSRAKNVASAEPNADEKTAVEKTAVEKTAAAPASGPGKGEKIASTKHVNAITKKLASAPKAGIEATRASLDKTVASLGALGHGFGKLNPFHKNASSKSEIPATATAAKPEQPKSDLNPESAAEPQKPQLGERIQMPDAEKTAATPEAQIH